MFLRMFASRRILFPLCAVFAAAGFAMIPFPPLRSYMIASLVTALGFLMAALQRMGAAERKAAEAARREWHANVFMALETANIEQAMSNEKLKGIIAETVRTVLLSPRGPHDSGAHQILRLIQGPDRSEPA